MTDFNRTWQWQSSRIIKRVTIIGLISYAFILIPYCFLILPPEAERYYRLGNFLLIAVSVTLINSSKKISRPLMACLSPLIAVAVETVLAIMLPGDLVYYPYIIAWEVVCFSYLNPRGLLIYLGFTNLMLIVLLLFIRVPLKNAALPLADEYVYFGVYALIGILLYFISRMLPSRVREIDKTGHTFETIMETTPSYMVIVNEKAEVEYISASLAAQLGLAQRQYAEKRPLLDLFASEDLKRKFHEFMEQDGYIEENFEAAVGEQKLWFMLRSTFPEEKGGSRFFEWMDITPIMEAKNEAESAARAKNDFLTNISHEIRTPMNAIIGMTDLMLSNPLEPEQMTRADTIKGAALSLLNIINDILDFSKIDARKMELICKPFDFASLIGDTVNMINIKANSAGLSMTTAISKDIPSIINLDEVRLKQCLVNILNNAVKFTKKGYIHLRSWAEPQPGGSIRLHFFVQDTGIGIKKEDMGKLFGEFQQLDTRKNRNIEGTGLGLAITRRLVELMGGVINVESVYGRGTTFSFYVETRGPYQGKLVELVDPERLQILCYEPHPYNARVFRDMLKDLSVPGEVCVDIRKTRTLLEAGHFSHVFFDRSGIEELREFFNQRETIFILIKEVSDKYERNILNVMNRPILIMSLADELNGKGSYERRRIRDDEDAAGSLITRDVRILVVDDNAVNLVVATGLLQRYGIAVETASGGEEAMTKVRDKTYDIIFMDHMMPGMDGLDTTRAIRNMGGACADVIIIALTANAMTGFHEQFLDAGMNGFLSKPIIIRNLRKILLRYLPPEKILGS